MLKTRSHRGSVALCRPDHSRLRVVTKGLLASLSVSAALVAWAAQGAPNMINALDEKIAGLTRSATDSAVSQQYFASVRSTLDDVQKAPIDPAEKSERIVRLVEKALAASPAADLPKASAMREKRNLSLILLGSPIRDIDDPQRRQELRQRASAAAVDFVRSLKRDVVVGYQPRQVLVNMGLDVRGTEAERARRYEAFLAENRANDEMNRYQYSLKSEVEFLEPKVVAFLDSAFAAAPADAQELQGFKERLRAVGPK